LGSGFAAGREKAHQHRAANQRQQTEDILAQHQIAGTDEQHPQRGQRNIEAQQELAEHQQHAQSVGGNGAGDRAEHAHGRKAHHVLGHAQHDMRGLFHQIDQHVLFLVVQVAQSDTEEQRKHQDLQHLIGGHGLEDVLGEDMGDEILEIQRTGLQTQALGIRGKLHRQAVAGLQHIGKNQAQKQSRTMPR
jgi:hypothetical protein